MATKGGDVDTLRVVLLGKTGAGKSSLGNSLANLSKSEQFKVGKGLKSETRYCSWNTGHRNGLKVEVTDTPGLCDTHLDDKLIYKEVAKSVAVAEPGPHVLVFTTRCDRRFTNEERQAYETIRKMFSKDMDRFLFVVFNGLDAYDDDAESLQEMREVLAKEVECFGGGIEEMLKAANQRYFGMNNKASPEQKEEQIGDLINMMVKLVVDNGHQFYTTPVTTEIGKEVEKLAVKVAKEENVSKEKAADLVKEKIVKEEVSPGFFGTIGGYISSAASGVKNACSVM